LLKKSWVGGGLDKVTISLVIGTFAPLGGRKGGLWGGVGGGGGGGGGWAGETSSYERSNERTETEKKHFLRRTTREGERR